MSSSDLINNSKSDIPAIITTATPTTAANKKVQRAISLHSVSFALLSFLKIFVVCSTSFLRSTTTGNGRGTLTASTLLIHQLGVAAFVHHQQQHESPSLLSSFHSRGTTSVITTRRTSTRRNMSNASDAKPLLDLAEYFKSLRTELHNRDKYNIHYVIGNPAGDADSIVSALTYAYIQTALATDGQCSGTVSNESSQKPTVTIPVVSIPRNDLKTQRPETMYLIQEAAQLPKDIESHLIYVDDHELLFPDEGSHHHNVTLVDHNQLCPRLTEKLKSQNIHWDVVHILDHHFDEGKHLEHCNDGNGSRNIAFKDDKALVASTCTLVTEKLLDLIKKSAVSSISSSLSMLLLGVVLIDSINMLPAAGRGTPRDKSAIDALLSAELTEWSSSNNNDIAIPDTTQLFEALQQSKFDPEFWKALSVGDALRLDYKQFVVDDNVFGASAILLPMKGFVTHHSTDIVDGIVEYMKQANDIHMLFILCFSRSNDNISRQLIFCGRRGNANNNDDIDKMMQYLASDPNTQSLQLEDQTTVICKEIPSLNDEQLTIRFFEQGNVKASRKQVAPIMMQFFSS